MPAPRLPWIKFWPEALDHEKFAQLSDAESWSWVVIWAKASTQPRRWRFASAAHCQHVTGRPLKHISRLVAAGLLDESDEGLVIHDARCWQDSENLTPTHREGWRKADGNMTEPPPKGGGMLTNSDATMTMDDLEGEGDRELSTPLPPNGSEPAFSVAGATKTTTRKKPKPARVPITDEDIEALVSKYAERYGNRQVVRDEIDQALNHEARWKNTHERLYVDGWLRRQQNKTPGWRVLDVRQPRLPQDRTGVAN